MSKETPNDDPRQRTDWDSHRPTSPGKETRKRSSDLVRPRPILTNGKKRTRTEGG